MAGRWSPTRHNYNGVPIPSPDTRPDLDQACHLLDRRSSRRATSCSTTARCSRSGTARPWSAAWRTQALVRITFDGKGGAQPAERWDVGRRVRDVEVAPDGALWMIEDANPGGLFRLTPLGMAVSAPVAQPATPASTPSGSATLNASNRRTREEHHCKQQLSGMPSHRTGRAGTSDRR